MKSPEKPGLPLVDCLRYDLAETRHQSLEITITDKSGVCFLHGITPRLTPITHWVMDYIWPNPKWNRFLRPDPPHDILLFRNISEKVEPAIKWAREQRLPEKGK